MEKEPLDINAAHRWNNTELTRLYRLFYKALVAYAMKITANDTAAEDIVQDVMSGVWQQQNTFTNESQLKAYLYNAVRNHCINFLRHRNVEESYVRHVCSTHEEMHIGPDGQEELFSEEIYRQLFLRIDQLPRRQREVLLLYMEGKKLQEIAEALHISRETVKQRKSKGLGILRSQMGENPLLMLLLMLS